MVPSSPLGVLPARDPWSRNVRGGVRGSRLPGPSAYHALMLAVVWHYWIGVALTVGVLLTVVALAVGYLKEVESTRYPKGR